MAGDRDASTAETVFFTTHPAWLPPVDSVADLPTGDDLYEGLQCFVASEDLTYVFDGQDWLKRSRPEE